MGSNKLAPSKIRGSFFNACKNLGTCYNKPREIPDEWLRQLSPYYLECGRKAVHKPLWTVLFHFISKFTYKLK